MLRRGLRFIHAGRPVPFQAVSPTSQSLSLCAGVLAFGVAAELAVKQESSDFKICPEGMSSHGAGRGIGGGDLLSQASRGSGLTERSTTDPGRGCISQGRVGAVRRDVHQCWSQAGPAGQVVVIAANASCSRGSPACMKQWHHPCVPV